MRMHRLVAAVAMVLALSPAVVVAQDDTPKPALTLSGEISPTHDPVMIKQGDTYYLFYTGRGVAWRQSKDMLTWSRGGSIFPELPAWAAEAVPGARNHLWAPDVSFFNGKYHLYYSVSTFGSRRSAIGLVTNKTLDPTSPDYKWEDQGAVIQSSNDVNYNAIDPNHVVDAQGKHWLAFGSFWGGHQLIAIDPATGKRPVGSTEIHGIAQRLPMEGGRATEAPFIILRDGWYYQFASYDFCCKGKDSTYRMVVGRSRDVKGPYLGKDGVSMMADGGAPLLGPTARWAGVGHNGIFSEGGKDYVVYHGYDLDKNGAQTLRISPITWTKDGWPVISH